MTNNRAVSQNIANLDLQTNLGYSLRYAHRDNYNQFFANAGINYQQNEGNFFSNFNITPTTTRTTFFYLPQNANNLSFNGDVDAYIPFIDAFVKTKVGYTMSNYKNILNNSELRNNTSQNISGEVDIRTVFDAKINFHNSFSIAQSQSKNQNNIFINTNLSNVFKIIATPLKNWYFVTTANYYIPNTQKQAQDYLFVDISLRHRPEKYRFELEFIANNILNKDNFSQVETTDFGISSFNSRLLSRYFMVNLAYNF